MPRRLSEPELLTRAERTRRRQAAPRGMDPVMVRCRLLAVSREHESIAERPAQRCRQFLSGMIVQLLNAIRTGTIRIAISRARLCYFASDMSQPFTKMRDNVV
ncbi:hypothetical protein CALCODRAFT_203114 [Calocera cornea HHB12733]|uniref:Uncharacterized protein n=1 Tax=Calocera cornea HHB12733 TaxID=1353952 RepID=A0A165JYD0_9BASI|nr:hypothetical protein CALCODRAFT_203114 [Calocera cornea HHB12733]